MCDHRENTKPIPHTVMYVRALTSYNRHETNHGHTYKHVCHQACLRDAACLVVDERVEMDAPVQVRWCLRVQHTDGHTDKAGLDTWVRVQTPLQTPPPASQHI